MATWLAMELEPERGALSPGVAPETFVNTGGRFDEQIQSLYWQHAQRYLRDLADAYARAGTGRAAGQYPELTAILPLGAETIVFDGELDVQLLQVYAVHGWPGLMEIERQLEWRRSYPPLGEPAPWGHAQRFFALTRHLLGWRISASLIRIEAICARRIGLRLQASARAIGAVVAALRITASTFDRGESGAGGAPGGPSSAKSDTRLSVGNRDLLAKIHAALDHIFRKTRVLARLRLELRVLDARIGWEATALRQKTEGLSGGVQLPSERAERDEVKEIESAERARRELEGEALDVEQALGLWTQELGELASPLLLLVPQLADDFTIDDTERMLVDTFQSWLGRIEDLWRAIGGGGSPATSHLRFDASILQGHLDVPWREPDPASRVVAGALERVADDSSQLPLLSEESLLALIESGEVAVGSLDHITCVQYVSALIEGFEQRREEEALQQGIAQKLASLAAGLSLASLVLSHLPTPQTRVVGGALRLLGGAVELPLMVFYAYSAVHHLGQLDEALRLRTISADFADVESVARLGEIISLRNGMVEQLSAELVKLLVENLVQGRWALVKRLILIRGYLQDLETLLPDDGDG